LPPAMHPRYAIYYTPLARGGCVAACGAVSITNKNLIFGTHRPQGRSGLSEAFDESRRRCTSALLDIWYLSNVLDGRTALRRRSRVPNASAFLSAGRPDARAQGGRGPLHRDD